VADVTEIGPFTTRLLSRSWLSADTLEIDLERPPGFSFVPGQGIRLFRGQLIREYSLICGPDDDQLSLCVQVVQKGPFSPMLAELKIGSSLSFSGPHGYFTFQPGAFPPLFVATGTGVAPFVSMVRAGISGFTFLQGAATQQNLYYRQMFQSAAATYVACVSRNAVGGSRIAWKYNGRVTDYLRDVLPIGAYDFYLCGRREMVRDAVSSVDARFPGSRVFFEIFF
jgi:ferredoxin-NADP reductase